MPPLLICFIALIFAFTAPAIAAVGAATTYGPGDGFVIPDNDPGGASSSIVITDSGEIQDLDLVLGEIVHTWLGDLIITLTHEDSDTSWNITNRAGQLEGGDETFGFNIDLDGSYTIDDESTNGSFHDQIGFEESLLPPGDYNSLGSLSNFDGLDIAGTWTLSISDSALGDTGELGSWSLLVETPNDASAGLVFVFEEIPGGVIGTLSGSLDLADSVSGSTNGLSAIGARINPPFPFISTGSAEGINVDSYLLASAPVFGPGEASSDTLTFASMFNGDFFALSSEFDGGLAFVPVALLPDGYASGTALSATMLFADATFDSLGITPGTYIYPLQQESPITLPPDGSSVCASDLRAGKTITVIAGEDAVLPFEDCIFASRFENDTSTVVPDFYTDRDILLENVQAGVFEDPYDDISAGPAGTMLKRSDGTFSYEVTAAGAGVNSLFNGNGFLSTDDEVDRLLFTFTGSPVTAVGGDFWTTDEDFTATGADIVVTLDDGTTMIVAPTSVDSFAGFVTEMPIVSLSIEATDSSFPAADNLIVGQGL